MTSWAAGRSGHLSLLACGICQERQRERREKKLHDLLDDYFYRSDHVGIEWEQGREKISKHSVTKEMEEEDW